MRPIVATLSAAGSTPALPLDIHGRPEVSLQVDVVSGSPTWTVEQTLDDVFDPAVTPVWFVHPDTDMVSQTVDRQGNYAYIPRAVRLTMTGSGVARLTIIQAGITG